MLDTLFLAILGTAIGSFFATVVLRSQGSTTQDKADIRSHCDHCGARLRWWELIPVLSYVGLQGRCACCRAPIPALHPAAEIITGLVSASALVIGGTGDIWAALWLGWLLALLTLFDLQRGLLPLPLTIGLLATGLAYAAWRHGGFPVNEVIAAAVGFAAFVAVALAYRGLRGREGLGGGDAVLLAGIGAWIGPSYLAHVVLGAAVSGLIAAGLRAVIANQPLQANTSLPLGPFLALAGWVVFLWQGGVAI